MKPRGRKVLIALGILVALLALGLWLFRDFPRYAVETTLAALLRAEVRLETLTLHGLDDFELRGLEVRRMAGQPALEAITVASVRIHAGLGELLDDHVRRVDVRGVDLRLTAEPQPVGPAPPPKEIPLTLDLLTLEDLTVVLGEAGRLTGGGELRDFGRSPVARFELHSEGLELGPLEAVVANLLQRPAAEATVAGRTGNLGFGVDITSSGERLEAEGRITVASVAARGVPAEASWSADLTELALTFEGAGTFQDFTLGKAEGEGSLRLALADLRRGEHRLELEAPSLAFAGRQDDEGGLFLTAEPRFGGLDSARLEATLTGGSLWPETAEAEIRGFDLGRWLPLLVALPAGARIEGRVDADLATGASGELTYSASTRLADFSLPPAPGSLELRVLNATFHVEGTLRSEVDPAATGAPWPSRIEGPVLLRFEVPNLVAAGGSPRRRLPPAVLPLQGNLESRLEVALTSAAGGAEVSGLDRLVLDGLRARLATGGRSPGQLRAEGRVEVTPGTGAAPDGRLDLRWKWSGAALETLVELASDAGLAPPPELQLAGRAKAEGRLRGALADPRFGAIVRLEDLRASLQQEEGDPLRVDAAAASLQLDGSAKDLTFELPETTATVTAPPLAPLELTLSAAGSLDAGTARLDPLKLAAGPFGRLEVAGSWSPPLPPRQGRGSLRWQGDGAAELLAALEPWIGRPLPPEMTVAGNSSARLDLRLEDGERWQGDGEMTLEGGGFSSADGSRVGQGLTGRWQVEASGRLADGGGAVALGPLEIHASGPVGGLLLLWGTYFADFSAEQAATELVLAASPEDSGAWGWHLLGRALLNEGPRLELQLGSAQETTAQESGWTYALEFGVENLATTLKRYLQDPFQGSLPGIDAVTTAGSLSSRLSGEVRGNEGSARGSVRLEGFDLAVPEMDLAATGVDLDLPLDLSWRLPEGGEEGSRLEVTGPPVTGSLRFAQLEATTLTIPGVRTALGVRGDRVTFEEDVVIPLLGGELRLAGLAFADLASPERHLRLGLHIQDLSLERAAQTFGLPPLEGQLDGFFPDIRLTGDRLRVQGDGELALFGGRVTISDISGREILSRYPRLQFSARFREIDLQQVTRTFDFGEMTGVIEGEVLDCVLFQNVPVRLHGRVESVRRPGVPQKISIKAINNIAILGTGSGVSIFDRGIHQFFQNYRYQGLGWTMQLAQDRFLLRGLREHAGKELFLEGRFPFRIDIVNAQPGQTVSFSTMLQRLKNLDVSAVKTGPGS